MELGRQRSQHYLRNPGQSQWHMGLRRSQQRIYLLPYVPHCGELSILLYDSWGGRDDGDGYGRGCNALANADSHRYGYRDCHSHRYRRPLAHTNPIIHRNPDDTNTNADAHTDTNPNIDTDTNTHTDTNPDFHASSALPAHYH